MEGCADDGCEMEPEVGRPPAERRLDDVDPVRAELGDVWRDVLLLFPAGA